MSSMTRIWPSQAADAPMPMVGTGTARVMRCGQRLGDRLQHDGEGAGLGDGRRIGLQPRPLILGAALRLEAAAAY